MVTFPTVVLVQQNIATDPSGSRHLASAPAGYIKALNTGAGGFLDFGSVNNTSTTVVSDTKCIYARASTLGDASGIFDMKFYLSSSTDWSTGTYRFLEEESLHFQADKALTAGASDVVTSAPANPNVGVTVNAEFPLGGTTISGIVDQDCTKYRYLAVLTETSVPVGTYDGAGFTYNLIYNFS